MNTWIVIKQWINSLEDPNEFRWDGQHHLTKPDAVSAGFRSFECDDFNVGEVKNGHLVWFGWMDNELASYDLERIEREIGLVNR